MISIKSIVKFPADVVAGDGIVITRAGATYTFSIDPNFEIDLSDASGVLPPANGGTGVANTGTFTLTGGNLTFTLGGSTNVTLPTTGTLITLGSTGTFTNKTFDTAGAGNVFQINGNGIVGVSGSGGSVLLSGSPLMVTPNLGTPSLVTLTNATGLPVATGISGLGTGVATFLATPSSANLRAAVTDESGTGALLFAGGALGAATATSINGLTITTSTGTLTVPNGVTLTGPASSGTAMTLGNTETVSGAKTFTSTTRVQGAPAIFEINATSSSGRIVFQNNGTMKWTMINSNTETDRLYIWDAGGDTGVYMDQNATAWSSLSDLNEKDVIEPVDGALGSILSVQPFYYTLKRDGTKLRRVGTAAQDWQRFAPEIVSAAKDGTLGVRQTEQIPYLIAAIQELYRMVEDLRSAAPAKATGTAAVSKTKGK